MENKENKQTSETICPSPLRQKARQIVCEDLYEARTTQITLTPKGAAIFSEYAVHIRIVDEAAGEFVEVAQEEGKIRIDREEWPHLRDAIEGMVAHCKDQE